MFLLPRPRRDLPFVLAPMQHRLSPREMEPPRRRRRDQPRSSSERCRAATDMTVGDGVLNCEYLYYSTIINTRIRSWKLQTPIKKNSKLNFGG